MNLARTDPDRLGKRKRADDNDEDDGVEDDASISENGFEEDLDTEYAGDHVDQSLDTDGEGEISLDDGDDEENLDVDLDENYNERMEELPKLTAYDPDLSKIGEKLTSTIEGILAIIAAEPCDSDVVRGFQSKANALREVPKPQPFKIALLGDTGAGKFSLGMLD